MVHNRSEKMNICCGKCLSTVTRKKTISIVSWSLVSFFVVGFISCLITTGLNKTIKRNIDDSLVSLNETDLRDYDFQTTETLLVSTSKFFSQ